VPPLQGVGVLVTRPELQSMALCRLLETQGASTLRLPALEIRPFKDRRVLAEQLGSLDDFDAIIFTSANAVRFGVSFLDQKRDLTLAAIGPATTRALNQAGYRVAINPGDASPGDASRSEAFDTESLLSHPRLAHVSGHRILIIKGNDGRQLLQQELMRRGAAVVSVNVYERVPSQPSKTALAQVLEWFAAVEIRAITATSLETGGALLNLATPALRAEFERAHWLVPNQRVASGLRALGLTAPLLTTGSPADQDLVAALIRWRSSESGA
jgi:uroporphyrinogen-III synthase